MKFLKQSTYIRYVIAKLSKLVQVSMLASSSILKTFLWKLKEPKFFLIKKIIKLI